MVVYISSLVGTNSTYCQDLYIWRTGLMDRYIMGFDLQTFRRRRIDTIISLSYLSSPDIFKARLNSFNRGDV